MINVFCFHNLNNIISFFHLFYYSKNKTLYITGPKKEEALSFLKQNFNSKIKIKIYNKKLHVSKSTVQVWFHSFPPNSLVDLVKKEVPKFKINVISFFYDSLGMHHFRFNNIDNLFVISKKAKKYTIKLIEGYIKEGLLENFDLKKIKVVGPVYKTFYEYFSEKNSFKKQEKYVLFISPNGEAGYSTFVLTKEKILTLYRFVRYNRDIPTMLRIIKCFFHPSLNQIMKTLHRSAAKANLKLIVKGREKDREKFKEIMKNNSDLYISQKDLIEKHSTFNLIKQSEFVISFDSFSCLEAAYFKKPCINLTLPVMKIQVSKEYAGKKNYILDKIKNKDTGSMINYPGVNCFMKINEVVEARESLNEYFSKVNKHDLNKYLNIYFGISNKTEKIEAYL